MQEITGFGMKGCLSLPGLRRIYFISLREEIDESVYTYNCKCKRWFVRQSTKEGLVCAYNQYNSSKSCDNILMCLAKEFKIDFESSTTYSIIENFFLKNRDQFKEIFENENNNQVQDYRDIIKDEKNR